MVSSLLLRWARSYAQTGQLGVGLPSYLVACCSSVVGIALPTDCFIPIDRLFVGGMLMIYSV